MNGGIEVGVEGERVVRLVATPPIAAKVLPGPMLMLVGSAAGLLEGDSLRLRVDLAPGSRLTVCTTAATIAHPCPGGGSTTVEVECRVGRGAQLAWLPEPLIACEGCCHYSYVRLMLERDAVVTWRDTVTLGRTGERVGRLEQRLEASIDGRPLLREGLRAGAPGSTGWDGPAVVGDHRHVAALHLLGRRVSPDLAGVMQLVGPGTTARFLAGCGDELARQVAQLLPFFLCPAHRSQEAVHV